MSLTLIMLVVFAVVMVIERYLAQILFSRYLGIAQEHGFDEAFMSRFNAYARPFDRLSTVINRHGVSGLRTIFDASRTRSKVPEAIGPDR